MLSTVFWFILGFIPIFMRDSAGLFPDLSVYDGSLPNAHSLLLPEDDFNMIEPSTGSLTSAG